MNDKLARIEQIVADWASDEGDWIDDLDVLCQIAEVLEIEVEARAEAK